MLFCVLVLRMRGLDVLLLLAILRTLNLEKKIKWFFTFGAYLVRGVVVFINLALL